MVSANFEKNILGKQSIVFTVPLPYRNPVFMSLNVNEYSREHYGIVIVDAEKFLHLWRSEPSSIHCAIANGSPETWSNDYKYKYAVDGFAQGRENPVPLADISYGIETQSIISHRFLYFGRTERKEITHYISFINGITRTIWLLTQGCTAFPIKCQISSARELYQIAAAPETLLYTVAELQCFQSRLVIH